LHWSAKLLLSNAGVSSIEDSFDKKIYIYKDKKKKKERKKEPREES
jgi:hypothetical protein